MDGQFLHAQGLAKVLQHHLAIIVRIGTFAHLQGVEVEFAGIFDAEFQQGELLPAHRQAVMDPLQLHIGQERNDEFAGQFPEFGLDLCDELAQNRRLFLLDGHFEPKVEGLDDGAAAHPEEVAESLVPIEHERKDIGILLRDGRDDGRSVMLPERIGPILIQLGLLETEFRRGLFHGLFVSLDEFAHAALE